MSLWSFFVWSSSLKQESNDGSLTAAPGRTENADKVSQISGLSPDLICTFLMSPFNHEKNKASKPKTLQKALRAKTRYISMIPHKILLRLLTDNTGNPFCYCQIDFCSNDAFNHSTAHIQLMAAWMAISRVWKQKTFVPFITSIKAKEEFRASPETAVTLALLVWWKSLFFLSLLYCWAFMGSSVSLWDSIKQVDGADQRLLTYAKLASR